MAMPTVTPTPVVVLDIGSTRFKAGVWRGEAHLEVVHSETAPGLVGERAAREGEAERYLEAATAALEAALSTLQPPVRLGLTTQRSTFLVWDASDGTPVSPLYSWQDRQAETWCARNLDLAPMLESSTGLRLSPHYFAPKLAWVMARDPSIAQGLHRGRLRAGTLDSFLLWRWSSGAVFVTDPTMAARTLLLELGGTDWSEALLQGFGIPRGGLPSIRPSAGLSTSIRKDLDLVAMVADQAAGLIGALGDRCGATLVNLGTGGFVLKPVGAAPKRVPGYLCGPYLAEPGRMQFALEGTMNGIGPAVDAFASGSTPPARGRSVAGTFCLPDSTGVGAPYWRPEMAQTFSSPARDLSAADRRRVLLEGILFRLCGILTDLDAGNAGSTIYLSGGLTREPMLAGGLATLVDAEVQLLEERESTLLGIAQLAAGLPAGRTPASSRVAADPGLEHLRALYPQWRRWMEHLMGHTGRDGA